MVIMAHLQAGAHEIREPKHLGVGGRTFCVHVAGEPGRSEQGLCKCCKPCFQNLPLICFSFPVTPPTPVSLGLSFSSTDTQSHLSSVVRTRKGNRAVG